jgi:hypothetical protein
MEAISKNSPEGTEKSMENLVALLAEIRTGHLRGKREWLPTEPVVSVKIPLKYLKKQWTASSTEQ